MTIHCPQRQSDSSSSSSSHDSLPSAKPCWMETSNVVRRLLLSLINSTWLLLCVNCGGGPADSLGGSDGGGGYGGAGGSPVGSALRLIAPLSTAAVTSRRPTLKWQLPAGSDGAHVQICRDRACAAEVTAFDVTGSSGRPGADLPPGVLYWHAYARSGGASGQASTPTWQMTVGARSAAVDSSWGTTVDVNGDGYADFISSANDSSSPTGRVYVYTGSATGLPAVPTVTFVSPDDQQYYFGESVAGAGDVNGDGFGDVVIGSYGEVYLYLGGPDGLSPKPAVTLIDPNNVEGEIGGAVAGVGDVNGDGYADVIVGAPTAGYGDGQVFVYLGGAAGLAANASTILNGPAGANAGFGNRVAAAGDVNGDGYADAIVGAQTFNDDDGRAYVYLGSENGLTPGSSVTLIGSEMSGGFGQAIACAGDVNGDGYADVIVGADRDAENDGRAYVYLGSGTGLTTTPSVTLIPPTGGDFAQSAVGVGDINGDGYGDVLAASVYVGLAYVYLGGSSGLSALPAATLADPSPTSGALDDFGVLVSGLGDVNGDGFADAAISAPEAPAGGRVYLYLGSTTGLGPSPGASLVPPSTNDVSFGFSVASVGRKRTPVGLARSPAPNSPTSTTASTRSRPSPPRGRTPEAPASRCPSNWRPRESATSCRPGTPSTPSGTPSGIRCWR